MTRKCKKPEWTHAIFKISKNGPQRKTVGWVLGKRMQLLNVGLMYFEDGIKLKKLHSYVEPVKWSRCRAALKIYALLDGAVLEDGGEYIIGAEETTFKAWLKLSSIVQDLQKS